jgi:anti-anti-sigma factor
MNASNVFEIQIQPEYTLVRFFGFVDAATVQQLKPSLQLQIPQQTSNLIIDLKDVGFLDSHGIGMFVSLLKQAHKNHGRVIFANTTGQPASVLQMVGFNSGLVTYCNTVNDAYRICEKKAGRLLDGNRRYIACRRRRRFGRRRRRERLALTGRLT